MSPVSALAADGETSLPPSPDRPADARVTDPATTAPAAAKPTRRKRSPAAAPPWRNRIVGHAEVAPGSLVANPANWRRHPARQQRALAGAIDEVGLVAGVTINQRTGHLVDGHLRLDLSLARGEPTVPVTYVDLSLEEERLVLASFDTLGAMASADAVRLEELLRDLTPNDAALRAMLDELAARTGIVRPGLTEPDDLPPAPDAADVYVRRGQTYQLGMHRLRCGDATDPADVATLLAGAEPLLLTVDPPWGVGLDLAWRDQLSRPGRPAVRGAEHRQTSIAGDARWDWSAAFELVPSLRVGYIWHAALHASEVAQGLARIGFEIVAQIIWDKGGFALGHGWYAWAHEPAWVVRKPGAAVPYLGPRNETTIWRTPSPKVSLGASDDGSFDHPTQKPVLLSEIPIRNHLRAGEAAYDPFVGSGSSIIAGERVGRPVYAMELEPRFAQLTIERWQAFSGRTAVRDA